jgi:NAD(P)-dependent dehydrogenase (short-subunit alcohol dehydrogenase family)
VTGCNAGIGKETVRSLAEQGAIVVLANRSKQRTQELLDELLKKYGESKIFFLRLDLSDLNSVREFATEFKNRF